MKKHHVFTLSMLGFFILYVSVIMQPREARADFRNNVAGTYLLNQSDGFLQILTINHLREVPTSRRCSAVILPINLSLNGTHTHSVYIESDTTIHAFPFLFADHAST